MVHIHKKLERLNSLNTIQDDVKVDESVVSDTLQLVGKLQNQFLSSKTMSERKKLGQFFTGSVVSDYMASLLNKPINKSIRILDAGAGTGVLTVSAALQCLEFGCTDVHAVLYELDDEAIPNLEKTLTIIQSNFEQLQKNFTFEIICADFVLSRPDKNKESKQFDIAVINPPYFKYSVKDSPYAKATTDLYHGNPNIYASFMAVVMACLKSEGQMVTITPRSFSNGLYFKGFRSYLLGSSYLKNIHIFKKRDQVFKNSNNAVLQENIICHFIKGEEQDSITIRSSDSDTNINDADEEIYSSQLLIDPSNDQYIIRIPESSYEASFLKQAELFNDTFEGSGYFISTGRVVEHRTRQFTTKASHQPKHIPLYRPHNVTPLKATWTGEHRKDASFALRDEHEKHTIKNGTFVLLKRFSSKDEKRRLVAGVHLQSEHECELIGFGNKLNYIGLSDGALTKTEAYGLAAIFNSSFMDKYFRCISGNTQVNATEIRIMKFPNREQVKEIGNKTKNLKTFKTNKINLIVNQVLGVIDVV